MKFSSCPTTAAVLTTALSLTALASTGCGVSVKYIDFNVTEGKREVPVKKFYNDGLEGQHSDDPTERAYQAVAHGDIKEGIRLGKEAVEARPRDYWAHYNLGILHEAAHEWDAARVQMLEAQRLEPKREDAVKEIAFIDAHK